MWANCIKVIVTWSFVNIWYHLYIYRKKYITWIPEFMHIFNKRTERKFGCVVAVVGVQRCAYLPPGPGCGWGCGNGVTPAVAGRGDKRCCFKLWRPSFLGAAVYPPLKYNGGLWRLGAPETEAALCTLFWKGGETSPRLANDTFCFDLP